MFLLLAYRCRGEVIRGPNHRTLEKRDSAKTVTTSTAILEKNACIYSQTLDITVALMFISPFHFTQRLNTSQMESGCELAR